MKLKIGIAGISGRIGQHLQQVLHTDTTTSLHCGLVSQNSHLTSTTVKLSTVCEKSDVWIDFSSPAGFDKVLCHCVTSHTPFVSGTTGLNAEQFEHLHQAGTCIAVLWASNFALSIQLLQQLLSRYSQLTAVQMHITETHHVHKADKPSGTSISLARCVEPNGLLKRINDHEFNLGEVKIKSIRRAEVAGIHQIELNNANESLCITHTAKTPEIFAQGAINVAKWLVKQKPGLYTMDDYIATLL